ncbi:MAG TPA: hypothetical protein DCZ23_02535 [Lachnospiraceae bacterium]|nr:hypothetical protein [Lachnospiraceae bacterium]
MQNQTAALIHHRLAECIIICCRRYARYFAGYCRVSGRHFLYYKTDKKVALELNTGYTNIWQGYDWRFFL